MDTSAGSRLLVHEGSIRLVIGVSGLLCRSFWVTCSQKRLNYLAFFQSFDFDRRTWWRLFQKRHITYTVVSPFPHIFQPKSWKTEKEQIDFGLLFILSKFPPFTSLTYIIWNNRWRKPKRKSKMDIQVIAAINQNLYVWFVGQSWKWNGYLYCYGTSVSHRYVPLSSPLLIHGLYLCL